MLFVLEIKKELIYMDVSDSDVKVEFVVFI